MEGISVDPPKEKLGTPGFLKSIQTTILHKLSPKQFKRRPKAPKSDDHLDVYGSQEGYEEEEDVYEEGAAEVPANCRSFEDQRHGWAHNKGKSLARTPVNKPRIYPDLTQEVEGEGPVDDESDDGDDESVDEAGPSKPIKKTRRLRVKGLAPTRQSNRLKERTATNPDSAVVETPPLDDRAVTPMQVSPSSDDDDYISPLPPANAGEEQTCPEDKLDTISVSVPAQPSPKVDVKPLPRLPLVPPPPHPPVDSKRRIVPKPPSEPTKLEPKEFKMEKKETPNPVERSTLTYQQHFHNMYRYLRDAGASKEDAAYGANLAANQLLGTLSGQTARPTTPDATPVCPPESSQSYYNSRKLLLSQQQQTIALLAQVPAFNGLGSTKFEDWIQHFERVMDTSEFEEGRKIKMLCSKLFGTAGDCVSTFQSRYPKEAQSFLKVKQCLHDRFHGGDSRKMYLTEYNNCVRNPGEPIRDYACRLQKLFAFAYPAKDGKTLDHEIREQLIMDKFLGGLKSNLRERMSFKEYKTFDGLIKATEHCAAVLNEAKLERRNVEFINAVSSNPNSQALNETKSEIEAIKIDMKANQKLLSDLMLQARETTKIINQVARAQIQPAVAPQQSLPARPQQGHQGPSHNNQNQQMGGNPYGGSRYCVHCKSSTHSTERCGFGPGGPRCFKCRRQGHLARECPEHNGDASQRYGQHDQNGAGQLNPFDQGN